MIITLYASLFLYSTANAFMAVPPQVLERSIVAHTSHQDILISNPAFTLAQGVRDFLVPPANAFDGAVKPPTNDEIKLLREALGALYGERNPEKALELLTKAISIWERQPPDEKAALFRVRADCYMVSFYKSRKVFVAFRCLQDSFTHKFLIHTFSMIPSLPGIARCRSC